MNNIQDTLENLMDEVGLNTVLMELAQVCQEKAEHLRSNWQDATTAKVWEQAAERIAKACSSIEL